MGKYDITLKDIFNSDKHLPRKFIEILTGSKPVKILPTELPVIKNRKVDMLLELENGTILHIEFQSYNDPQMGKRIHEYFSLLDMKYPGKTIIPFVVYVGNDELKMIDEFKNDFLCFKYKLLDIRKIDCNKLIESEDYEDKVLSVLCYVGNSGKLIGKLTEDMLKLKENERADFLKKLFVLSRLRPKINVLLGDFEKE
jgi:hypothetical protein